MSKVNVIAGKGEGFVYDTGIAIKAEKSDGEKCERCWIYASSIGEVSEHSTLCSRCANVVK